MKIYGIAKNIQISPSLQMKAQTAYNMIISVHDKIKNETEQNII